MKYLESPARGLSEEEPCSPNGYKISLSFATIAFFDNRQVFISQAFLMICGFP